MMIMLVVKSAKVKVLENNSYFTKMIYRRLHRRLWRKISYYRHARDIQFCPLLRRPVHRVNNRHTPWSIIPAAFSPLFAASPWSGEPAPGAARRPCPGCLTLSRDSMRYTITIFTCGVMRSTAARHGMRTVQFISLQLFWFVVVLTVRATQYFL